MKIELDDDIRIADFVRGIASVGLALSNVPGVPNVLRVHRAYSPADVIDLRERRERDAETDQEIRDGMRALHISIRVDGVAAFPMVMVQRQIDRKVRDAIGNYHRFFRDQLSRGAFGPLDSDDPKEPA